VLVVMPKGYGLGIAGKPDTAERKALAALPPPGTDLAAAGIRAVQALAAAKGVQVQATIPGSSGSGGGSNTTLVIVAVAITLLAIGAALEIVRRLRRRTRPA
jgi:hypothetical protein